GPLDRELERLREAQADPRRELLAGCRAGRVARRVDEHELGLLAGEANLDVAGGQLGGELHGGLREQIEQLQPQIRRQSLAEAARDLGGALVAEVGEALQVFLDPLEYDRQIHDDITM